MENLTFQLTHEFIELSKLLKFLGVRETGGMAKALVASGGVRVDGAVELRKGCKIRAGQIVLTEEARITVIAAPAAS